MGKLSASAVWGLEAQGARTAAAGLTRDCQLGRGRLFTFPDALPAGACCFEFELKPQTVRHVGAKLLLSTRGAVLVFSKLPSLVCDPQLSETSKTLLLPRVLNSSLLVR